MVSSIFMLSFLLSYFIFFISMPHAAAGGSGQWKLLKKSIGISAMHMQLLNNDRVVMFDRTDFGESKISLPHGKCRNDANDLAVQVDCSAHSVEYDVLSNSVRPLTVQTDVWCSSGTLAPDGRLIQTGGFNDGELAVRVFNPCANCDWEEFGFGLLARRWYSTDQLLPDGRAIIIGGRKQFNYEFYPRSAEYGSLVSLPFLQQTNDVNEENNPYPFVHLNVDGNLFIYANNRAILLDYNKNVIVRTYPSMPGDHPRNYPSTGSSVLLPVKTSAAAAAAAAGQPPEAEVLICGGAPRGSFAQAFGGKFLGGLDTCGRLKITEVSPTWSMETMPSARVMGDMILLPNGHVLLINGAAAGIAGWELGRDAVMKPFLYQPDKPIGSRFVVQNPTSIPRVYHSSAILLRDGRVLVGGSNPHAYYNFTNVLYPTELSLEAFSPSYLAPQFSKLRPQILSPKPQRLLHYGQTLAVRFSVRGIVDNAGVYVTMVAPSFTTHSFSMNQRLLILSHSGAMPREVSGSTYQVEVMTPSSAILAPPGYYMLFVIHQDIPSEGMWVKIHA